MHPAFWIGGNINTRALCLYLLIVAAWRRAVLCALLGTVENSSIFPLQTPDPHYTCANITGRKFYYHKLQMSNVCDARTDILDTSSWDNDSIWGWEQAFFNDFASGMSLTEYEETTARKTGVGPYTVHYDGWGSMGAQMKAAKAAPQQEAANAKRVCYMRIAGHGSCHDVNDSTYGTYEAKELYDAFGGAVDSDTAFSVVSCEGGALADVFSQNTGCESLSSYGAVGINEDGSVSGLFTSEHYNPGQRNGNDIVRGEHNDDFNDYSAW